MTMTDTDNDQIEEAVAPNVYWSSNEQGTVAMIDGTVYTAAELADLLRTYRQSFIDSRSQVRRQRDNAARESETMRIQLQDARTQLATARNHHESDIEAISERLAQEATRRQWCGEYEQVLDDLNGSLHIPLRPRQTEVTYEVTLRVNLTVNGSGSLHPTVVRDAVSGALDDGSLDGYFDEDTVAEVSVDSVTARLY